MFKHAITVVDQIEAALSEAGEIIDAIESNIITSDYAITSKATSLGATYLAKDMMLWTQKHEIKNIVVSDDDAERGSRAFAKDQRMLVELSSGASLSLVYDDHHAIHDYHC